MIIIARFIFTRRESDNVFVIFRLSVYLCVFLLFLLKNENFEEEEEEVERKEVRV